MSKKIIKLSAYRQKESAPRISVSIQNSQLIDFDQYRQKKERALRTEFKSAPRKTDLSDYRQRIVNGDYVVNPDAIAESILRHLTSSERQTNELPLVNPDRSS